MKRLLYLCALSMICLTGCGKEKVPVKINEVKTEKKDVTENKCAYLFAYNGYKMSVPLGYNLCLTETGAPMVFNDDFQMIISITDTPYENNTAETVTNKINQAGYVLDKEITSANANGVDYINGKITANETPVYFTYGNIGTTMSAQTTVLNNAWAEESVVDLFTKIAASAIVTSSENTTQDEIDKQSSTKNYIKDKCTLYLGSTKVTIGVGVGYESSFVNNAEDSNTESFGHPKRKINASLLSVDAGAEAYIDSKSGSDDWKKTRRITVNGHTFYYTTYTETHNESLETVQIVAAADVEGGILCITGYSYGAPEDGVVIEDMEDFMYIY